MAEKISRLSTDLLSLPGLKSSALSTELKLTLTQLSEIEYYTVYTFKLCEICQGKLSKVEVTGRNTPPLQGSYHL